MEAEAFHVFIAIVGFRTILVVMETQLVQQSGVGSVMEGPPMGHPGGGGAAAQEAPMAVALVHVCVCVCVLRGGYLYSAACRGTQPRRWEAVWHLSA